MGILDNVIKDTKDGVIIPIHVTPRSKTNAITGIDEWRNRINIRVSADARDGEANRCIIDFIKNVLEIDCVEIIEGHRSRNKVLLAVGDYQYIRRKIEMYMNSGGV